MAVEYRVRVKTFAKFATGGPYRVREVRKHPTWDRETDSIEVTATEANIIMLRAATFYTREATVAIARIGESARASASALARLSALST